MTDAVPGSGSYRVEELDEERVVLVLGSAVDHTPQTDEEQLIEGLLQKYDQVAIDASNCVSIRSEWLRFFRRLCLVGGHFKSHVTVVGLSTNLRDKADELRLTKGDEKMNLADTLDDAWE